MDCDIHRWGYIQRLRKGYEIESIQKVIMATGNDCRYSSH